MMRGYWRDPDLTATVVDADGFLHTGDLAHFDRAGNLVMAGRRKEMYIRGGYNVYPTEVEATLCLHPDVARTAVIGAPDPVLGEIGVAYVVARPGATPDRDDLRAWCRERIADYKAPDRVVTVEELPMTPVGKLDKTALAERWAGIDAAGATDDRHDTGGKR
jgi:acyl-CoA synthetase (AMP-forming)/AMP-acid ligase II